MFGFLNVYKPKGITSHDVVNRVRRATRVKQVGHGGTLDPMAEGVLPIAIGQATRLLRFLPHDKTYVAEILLGKQTDTDDITGTEIAALSSDELRSLAVTPGAVSEALAKYEGEIDQIPPLYSAIHQDGERLYDLARQGRAPAEIKPRRITVYSLALLAFENNVVTLRIHCSAGTYIRSIARDLGQDLGTRGCLQSLVREQAGAFKAGDALTLEAIAELAARGELANRLTDARAAISCNKEIICVNAPCECTKALSMGQKVTRAALPENTPIEHDKFYLLVDSEARLVVGKLVDEDRMKPEVVINHAPQA
jgi:tRNA pseudouridine55 synthase